MSDTLKRQFTFETDKSLLEYQSELSSITFPFSPADVDDDFTFAPAKFTFFFEGITDPGEVGVNNQDEYFILRLPESSAIVFGVFDGHGKSLGHIASRIARNSFKSSFRDKQAINQLKQDPQTFFNQIFEKANNDIRDAFRDITKNKGIEIKERNGYLYREKNGREYTVQGGTTATICVIVDDYRLYVANVGDSLACLGGCSLPSHESNYNYLSTPSESPLMPGRSLFPTNDDFDMLGSLQKSIKVLTDDHSPTSVEEYQRIRDFKCDSNDPQIPALQFIYDDSSEEKLGCAKIFNYSFGRITKNKGNFIKNARSEYACLVLTPDEDLNKTALSFTRSLGDFYMKTYGVTYLPSVNCYDLRELKGMKQLYPGDIAGLLVLGSDGLWDCYKFEDLFCHLLQNEKSDIVGNTLGIAHNLMVDTINNANSMFGEDIDNITFIMCYIMVE